MAFDHRKFLRDPDSGDTEPTEEQRKAFESVVSMAVASLQRATRGEVNTAIQEILKNDNIRNRVGKQLMEQIPEAIEYGIEEQNKT